MENFFATLNIVRKKGLKYKVMGGAAITPKGDFFSICAPLPKNKKQKEHLYKILKPYCGQLLLPDSLKTVAEFKEMELDPLHFKNRVLISSFMEYCKCCLPDRVFITGRNCLTPEFFGQLSRFAGQIILPPQEYDPDFCKRVLNICGTPLLFGADDKKLSAMLMLKKYKTVLPPPNCPLFSKDIFKKISPPQSLIIPTEFENFDPIKASAAMFFYWQDKRQLDFWKMLVIKENMIYNIV